MDTIPWWDSVHFWLGVLALAFIAGVMFVLGAAVTAASKAEKPPAELPVERPAPKRPAALPVVKTETVPVKTDRPIPAASVNTGTVVSGNGNVVGNTIIHNHVTTVVQTVVQNVVVERREIVVPVQKPEPQKVALPAPPVPDVCAVLQAQHEARVAAWYAANRR